MNLDFDVLLKHMRDQLGSAHAEIVVLKTQVESLRSQLDQAPDQNTPSAE